MIRWIVGQLHREAGLIDKVHQPVDELCAPTLILGSIIEIDHQGRDVIKAWAYFVAVMVRTMGFDSTIQK